MPSAVVEFNRLCELQTQSKDRSQKRKREKANSLAAASSMRVSAVASMATRNGCPSVSRMWQGYKTRGRSSFLTRHYQEVFMRDECPQALTHANRTVRHIQTQKTYENVRTLTEYLMLAIASCQGTPPDQPTLCAHAKETLMVQKIYFEVGTLTPRDSFFFFFTTVTVTCINLLFAIWLAYALVSSF